jgi:hypothetical protein
MVCTRSSLRLFFLALYLPHASVVCAHTLQMVCTRSSHSPAGSSVFIHVHLGSSQVSIELRASWINISLDRYKYTTSIQHRSRSQTKHLRYVGRSRRNSMIRETANRTSRGSGLTLPWLSAYRRAHGRNWTARAPTFRTPSPHHVRWSLYSTYIL